MFKFTNRQELLCLLVLGVLTQTQMPSFALHDVVKAKTISDENEIAVSTTLPVYTFNDPQLPNFSEEDSVSAKIEKKINKKLFNKRKSSDAEDSDILPEAQAGEEERIVSDKPQVSEEVVADKNKFLVDADRIFYEEQTGVLYAQGHVKITAKLQNVVLMSDEAVLDKTQQTVKLSKNVKILKDGVEMLGESLVIDLNEQNILMDNPVMNAFSFVVNAQEGYLIANDVQMLNGSIKSAKKTEYPLVTTGFMKLVPIIEEFSEFKDSILVPPQDEQTKRVYRIDSKQIVITSYKDHDSVLLKGSNVFYNDKKVIRNSDLEIISDKQQQVVETNMPEGGTFRGFGTYIGYGIVSRLPKGHSLKIMPALTYGDSNIGVGVIGRYRSQNGMLEGGWNTSTTNVVARGVYRFSNNLKLDYGRNAYMPEGFMGARRSGYAAQLSYLKRSKIDDLGVEFSNGIYAGIFSDYRKHKQEQAYATTRFRYMAQLSKKMLEYENKEQSFNMTLSGIAQAAATLYGSGETHGIVRVGPVLQTKYKKWDSAIGYMMSGIHGDSPFDFDRYRYGKSTITLNEKFNFTKNFAFGFRLFISPLKDNYKNDLLTETRIYALIGPQDLKVALSYDFVRDIAHVDFMMLLGSDSAKINFDKLITKNVSGNADRRDFYKEAKQSKVELPENI